MPSPRPQHGFTLVEVLVAAAVVAIGLLGVLTAFSMATRVTAASENDTVLTFLAHQKLAEIQIIGRDRLPVGTSQGNFAPDFPEYLWRLTVHTPDDNNVARVDLLILIPEAGREREVLFSTLVF